MLDKSPGRSSLRTYCGAGYMIVNSQNTVVAGCANRAYQATLDEVESFAFESLPKQSRNKD